MPLAFAVSGAAFLIHEAEPVALSALGVPAPRRGLDRSSPARCSRSAARFSRARPSANAGFALLVRRARGLPLLLPRPRADLRAPLADRGGAAPVRRLLVLGLLAALASPAGGFGARDAAADVAGVSRSGSRLAAAGRPARVRPERDGAPERDPRPRRAGQARLGRRAQPGDARRRGAACSALPKGALHRALERDLERQPRRPRRVHVRRADEGAARSTEASGASGPTTARARRPLAVLPLPRAARRRARLPAARPARRR